MPAPTGAAVQLTVGSQGPGQLRYDGDGNGSLESVLAPVADVGGTAAGDDLPPTITISRSGPLATSRITIQASDASGVSAIRYSLDGTTYEVYSGPLTVNASQVRRILAFAEDTAGNRSTATQVTLSRPIYLPMVRR